VAQDHNDIYSIVERLRILEEGLDKNQRSVNQLGATFKPKTVAVLTAKTDPKNPMGGKLVGGCEESVANEDVLEKVKSSLTDYLKSIEDKYKDADLKDKKTDDGDLKDKVKKDLDLIAKELDEDHQELEVGDRVMVTGPNHYEGEFAEVAEFSPSGKFVVVKFDNGDEASMHLSDVEFHDDQEDVEDEVNEDPTSFEPTTDMPAPVETYPTLPESAPVKTVTNECGLWEIHGNEPTGFEIRHGNNAMHSKFKSIDEAVMALEMFAARKKAQDESADYIEEA
jgi:hypothetical protein